MLVEGEVEDSSSMGGGGWQQEEEMEGQRLPTGRSANSSLARMRHSANPTLGSQLPCQAADLL